MKKLFCLLFLLGASFFIYAQKPKVPIKGAGVIKKDTTVNHTKFPVGLYILTLSVEDGTDLLKALQQTDYSKVKTDRVLNTVFSQMKIEEDAWSDQQRPGTGGGTNPPIKDSTSKK